MDKFLKASLLTTAVLIILTACTKAKAEVMSFEDESGYAIGVSMGRYISNTLKRQQESGIKLDKTVILKGVTDGLSNESKLTDEEIKKVLQRYDAKINALTQAKKDDKSLATNAHKEGVKSTASSGHVSKPSMIEAFKSTFACVHGEIVPVDSTYVQCKMSDDSGQASITSSKEYSDITITINGDSNGNYTQKQRQFLVAMLREGAVIFDKKPSVANYFENLPLSSDANKITKVEGVKFNIPSKKSLGIYNNYMVIMTK